MRDERDHSLAADGNVRYRVVPFDLLQVTGQLAMAVEPDSCRVITGAAGLGVLLEACCEARTLPDHADTIRRRRPRANAEEIDALLRFAVSSGLLRGLELTRTSHLPIPMQSASAMFTVTTADRPHMLTRALKTYTTHLEQCDGTLDVVVVDGSREGKNKKTVKHLAADAHTRYGRQVRVVGSEWLSGFCDSAITSGFPARVINWALRDPRTGYEAGRVRNMAALASAGRMLLTADDDTLGVAWGHRGRHPGLAFVGHEDPREMEFFKDRQTAVAVDGDGADNLVTAHMNALGQSIRTLAEGDQARCTMERACPHLLSAIDDCSYRHRIRATWTGIAGDGATHCPYLLLFVTGSMRERLAGNEAALRLGLKTREVRRIVPCLTVTDEPLFMAYCASLDNTTLLPPFAPEGFNEDGLFGSLLRICDPTAFVAQLPVGIVHDSARASAWETDVMFSATSTRVNDVIRWLASQWAMTAREKLPTERMPSLGRFLVAWGSLDHSDLKHDLTQLILTHKVRVLRRCEVLLNGDFQYPPFWRTALERYARAVQGTLTSDRLCVPREDDALPLDAALAAIRDHVRLFGETLILWPDVWAFAKAHACEPDGPSH